MSGEPDHIRPLFGFVIALAVMVAVSLGLFLPLFLWLPAHSLWRYLVWGAALFGPLLGGELGARLARRIGHPAPPRSLQQAAFALIVVLGTVSILPYLTRT